LQVTQAGDPDYAFETAKLEEAFAAMARMYAQAVVVLGFGPYIAARQRLAEVALRYRLPTVFPLRDHL
jgi:hypothetical protein